MEIIAMPFIFIYHVVHYILLSPKRILNYAYSGVLAVIDKLSRGKVSKRKEEKAKEYSAILEVESMMNATRKSANKKATLSKEPEFSFRYKIRGSNGKIINGTFEGPSADEVKIFLQNEGYEVLEVVPRKFYDIDVNIGGKFKAADLSFSLTQLSTYLKAGIALIDSVRILEKQSEKSEQRKVYQKVVYELLKGENLSTAMERQGGKFPVLLVNMIKTAELTGDLTSVLDDMADYYNVPVSQFNNIKNGADWIDNEGNIIPYTRLTKPSEPARSYAYCSDTRYMPELHEYLKGVNVLYHESTYLNEDEGMARQFFHSTASQAAQVASDAGVNTLVLGHYSARYNDESILLSEAKEIFPNSILSDEGLTIDI